MSRRPGERPELVVGPVVLGEHDGTVRATAAVRSPSWEEPRSVWFEVPADHADADALTAADPWVAALLLVAMRQHEDLRIDAPLSPELAEALPAIGQVYRAWLPALATVDVHASGVARPTAAADGEGLFFSCGVDSWHSLLRALERRDRGRSTVTHLLNVAGVDVDVEAGKESLHDAMRSNTARIANEVGVAAVALATNVRRLYTSTGISWRWGQAGGLAALALTLQRRLATVSIVERGPTATSRRRHGWSRVGRTRSSCRSSRPPCAASTSTGSRPRGCRRSRRSSTPSWPCRASECAGRATNGPTTAAGAPSASVRCSS